MTPFLRFPHVNPSFCESSILSMLTFRLQIWNPPQTSTKNRPKIFEKSILTLHLTGITLKMVNFVGVRIHEFHEIDQNSLFFYLRNNLVNFFTLQMILYFQNVIRKTYIYIPSPLSETPLAYIHYGEILCISPYSVQMQENTDRKKSEYGNFSRSVHSTKTLSVRFYIFIWISQRLFPFFVLSPNTSACNFFNEMMESTGLNKDLNNIN